jgi:hypothetical protein
MLNATRMKVYINAYLVRLDKGEALEDIDKSYLDLKRLTEVDIKKIHDQLNILNKK